MTQDNIDEVKNKMVISEVVSDYVKLKKQGANLIGLCPFHSEKSGSFTVSPAKKIYKCFGCGKSGDAIQFLIDHEKKSFHEAIEVLAKKYGIELEGAGKKEFVKPTARIEKLGSKILDWFETDRKISNDTLLRFGVTESNEWMPQFQKEVPAVCFNYFKGDELVNIKFRGPQKSFKLAKDAELIFYNLNAIDAEETAVIVEGEIDCLSMYEAKVYNCISVPNGTPPGGSKMNLEYLDNCWGAFGSIKKIILAVDNDEVGRNLREELARRLGKDRCFMVDYPEGCKDANEVLIKYGAAVLSVMVENAKRWPLEGIVSMDTIYPTVMDWYQNGYPLGSSSKIPGFDAMLKFSPGEITTVTGIPGHGKDEFFNWVMASLSIHEDWKFGMCGFEETPEITTTKIAEKLSGKSFGFRLDHSQRIKLDELDWCKNHIADHFFFYNADETDTTVDGIISKANELVLRFGIQGLYINPWNWVDHNREAGLSETEYVSRCYSKLIRFARVSGVHIFLIAHTTKMEKDKNTDKYKVPTLYSISGSANFFNKTHNGVCVYRHYDSGAVDVYIQKVKQSWNGEIGWGSYNYDTMTRQYTFVNTSLINRIKEENPF